jgi:hypothetical protein
LASLPLFDYWPNSWSASFPITFLGLCKLFLALFGIKLVVAVIAVVCVLLLRQHMVMFDELLFDGFVEGIVEM